MSKSDVIKVTPSKPVTLSADDAALVCEYLQFALESMNDFIQKRLSTASEPEHWSASPAMIVVLREYVSEAVALLERLQTSPNDVRARMPHA